MLDSKIKIRIIFWGILATITLWLLFMAVVPSGRIVYRQDFSGYDFFIRKLTPLERVLPPQDGGQVIIGDPVYFNLHTPRPFDSARLTLVFKRSETGGRAALPVIEAGVMVDKDLKRYDLKPIDNSIIDQLALVWNVTAIDGFVLLQKEKKYNSLNEFISEPPPVSEIAVYNYDFPGEFILPDYQPAPADGEQTNSIAYALRGDYQAYLYIKDEDLDLAFEFSDLNQNKDSDPVYVNLYYKNKLIEAKTLEDDENTEDNGQVTEGRLFDFKVSGLPEGVYKIEIRANSDIITEKIETAQSKLSFINKLWLADAGKTDITLFTDSRTINAQTTNPAKLQTIKANSSNLAIEETYRLYSTGLSASTSRIEIAKDDVMISGSGVFAFSREALFNPKLKTVSAELDYGEGGINYIIAGYQAPVPAADGLMASAEYDLRRAYREDGNYNFVISIPGLRAEDDIDDSLILSSIEIELEGRSLWDKIKEIFGR